MNHSLTLLDQFTSTYANSASLFSLTPQQLTQVIADGIERGTKPSIFDWQIILPIVVGVVSVWFAWRSNRAAERSAEIAKAATDAASAAQRPRFIVEKMLIGASPTDNEKVRITVKVSLKNYGTTTAEMTREYVHSEFAAALPSQPAYPPALAFNHIHFGIVVPSGDSYICQVSRELERDEFEQWYPQQKKFWVYGFICYRDQFDTTWSKGFAGQMPTPPHIPEKDPNMFLGQIFEETEDMLQPFDSQGIEQYSYTRLDGKAESSTKRRRWWWIHGHAFPRLGAQESQARRRGV
jgi:hypothetical protein